ncbi:MAG: YceI family protein [Cytophagales bacterium]|nr:YceI family protein [Cytophaga sp.]
MKKYSIVLSALFLGVAALASVLVTFKPDYTKSKVAFQIKNAGINVNGTFDSLTCRIQYNEKVGAPSAVDATIYVKSVDTNIGARDKHLRGNDYFDVEKYPKMTFASTQVLKRNSGKFEADGNLTIKGVTKAVKVPFTFTGTAAGGVFEAELLINRRDYNVGGGSVTMSDDVTIKLSITAAP